MAGVGQTIGASTAAVSSAQERLVRQKPSATTRASKSRASSSSLRRASTPKRARTRRRRRSKSAEAGVREAEAELERAKQELGPKGADNPQFREALAAVEKAKLDLVRTTVSAPSDGVVTNLQLTLGQFVAVGQAALTFIDARDVWFNANFRENSLENIKPDAPVEVVLDVLPGRIFPGKVQSVGWGVSQGLDRSHTGTAEDQRADGARPQSAALHREDRSG